MRRIPAHPSRQRGAVLYVALIFLVILALIGTAGMQVALMQERMSANYRATNVAFQRAEAVARNEEAVILAALDAAGSFVADQERCDPSFSPAVWAEQQSLAAMDGDLADGTTVRTRRVDLCTPGGTLSMGGAPLSEKTDIAYEISAFAADSGEDPSSDAAIDTIFIP